MTRSQLLKAIQTVERQLVFGRYGSSNNYYVVRQPYQNTSGTAFQALKEKNER